MSLIQTAPTFTDAVDAITPDDVKGSPFCSRWTDTAEKQEVIDQWFLPAPGVTEATLGRMDVHEINGEGPYGYVLTIYDNRDVPIKFYAHPYVNGM